MKVKKMSLETRRELIEQVQSKYQHAPWREKSKVLDGFIETTGYQRKYAICLLNGKDHKKIDVAKRKLRACHQLSILWRKWWVSRTVSQNTKTYLRNGSIENRHLQAERR